MYCAPHACGAGKEMQPEAMHVGKNRRIGSHAMESERI